jgi:hypothetical protein
MMQKLHQLILKKKKWHHLITETRGIDLEEVVEDTDMDTGGNENNATSSGNTMCSETLTVLGEDLSISDYNLNNNGMDYTTSPRPTTITATSQSNGEFTPVLNGSPNRRSSLERRNTTPTTNNSYSALHTTSTTKESNSNNTNNNNITTNPFSKRQT